MSEKSVLYLTLSGVRVREAETLALGMSLPGFVERAQTIAALPSLGLLILAGLTPEDWDIEYRELDKYNAAAVDALCDSRFGMVAISALTARIPEAYKIADKLRSAGRKVVLGGLHVSVQPDEARRHADTIVVGEAEPVWPQILKDYADNTLRPLYHAQHQFSLDDAPLPRYDLLDPDIYNRLPIQTTRGCPLDCEFCGASRLISRYKRKPMNLIRRDLENILEHWPRPFIELADDNTFVNKSWGRELAQLFREYSIRWFTETDISVADDDHLLELLADSGCAQLLIGLESASPEALSGMDSRDWKLRRLDGYLDSIQRIQSHGISVNGCFTLGLDADGPEAFERTRDFIMASGLSDVQVTILTPFPGTELFNRLERANRLLRPVEWDRFTLFDVTYQPARMSAQELEDGFKWLLREVYSDEMTAQRKQDFYSIARHARRVPSDIEQQTIQGGGKL